MGYQLETLGNAMLQVRRGTAPVLVTDPWLVGRAYFGSWAHDKPLSEEQVAAAAASPFVWISHGHPDHLHHESLELIPKGARFMLPDHYSPEIADGLRADGREVEVLRYKQWVELEPGLRVQCLQNANQDAMLLIEADGVLVINKNDAPTSGLAGYLRRLARDYRRVYLASLCAIDADMLNIVDASGERVVGPPDERKPGAIWDVADLCARIGADVYLSSSSQHMYVRADSAWANPYRITFEDVRRHWNTDAVLPVEPYVSVDLESGAITRNHPSGETDWSQLESGTAEDDWDAPLSEEEWASLEAFFGKFELLAESMDFVRFTVGGETREFTLRDSAGTPEHERVGVRFHVPRNSLLEAVKWGYFDDLLIGNFMRTELFNMELYPNFTPIVAKLGGNAKVFDRAALERFEEHHRRLDPAAWRAERLEQGWRYRGKPFVRDVLTRLGVLELSKRVGRAARGLPPLPRRGRSA